MSFSGEPTCQIDFRLMSTPLFQISHNKDLGSVVIDVLALIDTETTMMPERKEERERFIILLRESDRYVPEEIMKERLDIDTLGEAGILKNPKKFFNTVIKLKTKLL